jgi:hypothetical protein
MVMTQERRCIHILKNRLFYAHRTNSSRLLACPAAAAKRAAAGFFNRESVSDSVSRLLEFRTKGASHGLCDQTICVTCLGLFQLFIFQAFCEPDAVSLTLGWFRVCE